MSEEFDVKFLGELKTILNMSVSRDRAHKKIEVHSRLHIAETLNKYAEGDLTSATPMTARADELANDKSPPTTNDYRNAVGALMHIANTTRPDLAYAMSVLSRFNHAPRERHWQELQKVLRYLRNTRNYGLIYGGENVGARGGDFDMRSYCDSDFATDSSDRLSQGGFTTIMNGAAVTWSSKKISINAQSSTEAEFIVAAKAANEMKWINQFLHAIGNPISLPQTLYCDNKSTVASTQHPAAKSNLKHIDIRAHAIRHYIESNLLVIKHIRSEVQTADIFTKGLSHLPFARHRLGLGVVRIVD